MNVANNSDNQYARPGYAASLHTAFVRYDIVTLTSKRRTSERLPDQQVSSSYGVHVSYSSSSSSSSFLLTHGIV